MKCIDEFWPVVGRDDATANFVTHWSPMPFDSQCGLSPIFSMIIHTKNAYITKYQPVNKYQCGAVRHVLSAILFLLQIAGQKYSERSDYSIPTHSVHSFLQTTCFPESVSSTSVACPDRCPCCLSVLCFRPSCFSGMWIIFDPLDICQFWSCNCNILYVNMLHAGMERVAPAKTPFRCYLLALV